MDTHQPVSDRIRHAVDISFPSDQHDAVLRALATVKGEAGQEAILVFAKDDISTLQKLVERWHVDERDVLIYRSCPEDAGLTRDMQVARLVKLGLYTPRSRLEIVEEEVRAFIAKELLVRPEQLGFTTRLQQDLGMRRAAGQALMRTFADQFKVDMRDFQPGPCFRREVGESFFSDLLDLILRRPPAKIVPITFGDLVQAAIQGRWIDAQREPE